MKSEETKLLETFCGNYGAKVGTAAEKIVHSLATHPRISRGIVPSAVEPS